jgi:outer membrane protein TolC
VVRESIQSTERYVNLTLTRYDQGLTNEGDVLLARRELEALNALLPSLNTAIFEAESRIALLLSPRVAMTSPIRAHRLAAASRLALRPFHTAGKSPRAHPSLAAARNASNRRASIAARMPAIRSW